MLASGTVAGQVQCLSARPAPQLDGHGPFLILGPGGLGPRSRPAPGRSFLFPGEMWPPACALDAARQAVRAWWDGCMDGPCSERDTPHARVLDGRIDHQGQGARRNQSPAGVHA
jgi:hypothetical protein